MINCTVTEDRMGNMEVLFDNGKSIYLQADYHAQFGVDCGVIKAPQDWDGNPSNLPDGWWEYDCEEIIRCPEHYLDGAE